MAKRCAYVKRSLKVWQDFSHVISDHRLVTCQLSLPKLTSITYQDREVTEEKTVSKVAVPKWKRRNKDDQVWGEFRTSVAVMVNDRDFNVSELSRELVRCMHAAAQQSFGQKRLRSKRKRFLDWDTEL